MKHHVDGSKIFMQGMDLLSMFISLKFVDVYVGTNPFEFSNTIQNQP